MLMLGEEHTREGAGRARPGAQVGAGERAGLGGSATTLNGLPLPKLSPHGLKESHQLACHRFSARRDNAVNPG